MKRFCIAVVFTALISCVVMAGQTPAAETGCDNANTQDRMDRCASDTAAQADKELNAVYKRLIASAASDRVAMARFRAFQRAWLQFRKTYIEAAFPAENKHAVYGTMFPMEADDLYARLTRDQIKTLTKMLIDCETDKAL